MAYFRAPGNAAGGSGVASTTEHGLPLDLSQAMANTSFSEDRPLYRSIDLLTAPRIFENYMGGAIPMKRTINPDGKLMSSFVGPMHSPDSVTSLFEDIVEPDSGDANPPIVERDFYPLEKTNFDVASATADEVIAQLKTFFSQQAIDVEEVSRFKLRCLALCDQTFVNSNFVVRLFSAPERNRLVVEFQRRGGCAVLFANTYRMARTIYHKAPKRGGMGPPPPVVSPPLAQSTSQSQEWTMIARWMTEDASEALKSIGVLSSQGITIPSDIMSSIVASLSDATLRVLALQVLAEALPVSRASVSSHVDTIIRTIALSITNGSNLEQFEACKVAMNLTECFPELSGHDLIDELTAQLIHARTRGTWDRTKGFAEVSLSRLQLQAV